jgi:hypothetical protein
VRDVNPMLTLVLSCFATGTFLYVGMSEIVEVRGGGVGWGGVGWGGVGWGGVGWGGGGGWCVAGSR